MTTVTPSDLEYWGQEDAGVGEALGEAKWIYTFERTITPQINKYLKELYPEFLEYFDNDADGITLEKYLELGAAFLKLHSDDIFDKHFSFGYIQHHVPTGYDFEEEIRKAVTKYPKANLMPKYIEWLFGGTEYSTEDSFLGFEEPHWSFIKDDVTAENLSGYFGSKKTIYLDYWDDRVHPILTNPAVTEVFDKLGVVVKES